MHQSGHSRAHNMQLVQFSSSRAMTPRVRGGRWGWASGYSAVWVGLAKVLAVVASPLGGVLCECGGAVTSTAPPILWSVPAEIARGVREPSGQDAGAGRRASGA